MRPALASSSFWQGRVRWFPQYLGRFVDAPIREVKRLRFYSSGPRRDAFLSFQAHYVANELPAVRNLRPTRRTAYGANATLVARRPPVTDAASSAPLRELFTVYGSDKATIHDYDVIYEAFAELRGIPRTVLEIGLGTSSLLPSSMGPLGSPGASARAFRDWGSFVIGCDIDEQTLFSEPGILTLQVDQLTPRTFRKLEDVLKAFDQLDLVVIDGLHTPEADLNSLLHLAPWLAPSGLLVVEDVENDSRVLDIWGDVLRALPDSFCARVVETKAASVVLLGLAAFWSAESLANLYRARG